MGRKTRELTFPSILCLVQILDKLRSIEKIRQWCRRQQPQMSRKSALQDAIQRPARRALLAIYHKVVVRDRVPARHGPNSHARQQEELKIVPLHARMLISQQPLLLIA
jgi:hypothetical protein